jgi:hypothetical protein
VDPLTSDVPLPTQDGGNCSDMRRKVPTLSMKEERSLKSKEESTLNKETSLSEIKEVPFINNGTSFTSMNTRENQERENSTKDLVSMLKETSTLFLNFQKTDTSRSMTTGTSQSRLLTEEDNRFGISTNNL